jgi:hypothetical protein
MSSALVLLPIFMYALLLGAVVIFVQAVVRISQSLESMSKAMQDLAVTLRHTKTY